MTLPYGKVWNDDAGQLDSSVFGISAMTGGRAGSKPAPTVFVWNDKGELLDTLHYTRVPCFSGLRNSE